MSYVKETIKLLIDTFPESSFNVVKNDWIKNIENQYSVIPINLKSLYNELGYGTIGDGYYSIHVLLEPEEIYDPETAKNLTGKLIVGDDFAGNCHAYDAQDNWSFGYVNCNGEFEKLEDYYSDFIDYLNKLCQNEKS